MIIYEFLADGFEEVEALAPVDLLHRAKFHVITVGIGGRTVTSSHGVCIEADLAEQDINLEQNPPEMVILPGGMPGTRNLEASATVKKAVMLCAHNGGYLAAICAAPSVLGHWGLLAGHAAICFPGYEKELHCEKISSSPVVQSGRVITAKGAGVAVDFGLKLVEVLCGEQKSQDIRKSIQCV